jgi:hypothetical protein
MGWISCALMACAIVAIAATPNNITGTWRVTVGKQISDVTPLGTHVGLPTTFDFKVEGKRLSGRAQLTPVQAVVGLPRGGKTARKSLSRS